MNGTLHHKTKKPIDPLAIGCAANTRVGYKKIGNVEWMFTCHFLPGTAEPTDLFDFVSVIGHNPETGETCFFGHNNVRMTSAEAPIPGGKGLDDVAGRAEAAAFWNEPSYNTCVRCHSANKPWAITPHLQQRRYGGDGSMDIVPETPFAKRMHTGWGYRIIGTVHNLVMKRPHAIWPRNDDGTIDNTCTSCHVISDEVEYQRLSHVAVGLPDLPPYSRITQFLPHYQFTWMPWGSADPSEVALDQAAVKRIDRAIADPKYLARQEEILSPCPEPVGIASSGVNVSEEESGSTALTWIYRNDLGGVPLRDDVRFEVTVQGSDGESCAFKDVAPRALGSDQWSLRLPARSGVGYRYRIRPYRYCFDQTGYAFGNYTEVIGPLQE